MHPTVQAARKQVDLRIGFLTVMGISLLVGYILILIPALTFDLVLVSLGVQVPFTAAMIIWHIFKMNRRWKIASDYLEKPPEKGGEVTAHQALKAMIEFPVWMPLFGCLAWVVGGLAAAVGPYLYTHMMMTIADFLVLYLGILAAAVIITIFQFYSWRKQIDPVVGLIIHRAPEVLNGDFKVMRLSLKQTLLFTLLLIIVLVLFISEMAGYRQASDSLQNYIGKSKAERLNRIENNAEVDWDKIDDETLRAQAFEVFDRYEQDNYKVRLLDPKGEGYEDDFDLISQKPYDDITPAKIVLKIFEKKMKENASGFTHAYNNFGPTIDVFRKIQTPEGKELLLIFSYPWENYSSGLSFLVFISIVLMCVVILLTLGVVHAITQDLSIPISRLVEFTEELGAGNLHEDVFYHANDEVGDLSISIRRMSGQLSDVLRRVQGAARSLDQATSAIRQSADSVKDGAKQQGGAIDDVASAMTEMDQTIQGIAENVEILSSSTEESSASIFEMGAAIKKINESVDILNQSIADVSSSINEMTAAVNQVADNVGNLSAVTEETASSMAQMDASIRQVESNTKETAEWSKSVIADAEAGVESVSLVTTGMNDIAKVVHAAQTVIERLGARVEEIGKIVKVIDDVANQTNLLALNAAIIAAQAGEHGRGFAVVADEIKQLAERTTGSTREIHQLIRGVQSESRQAVGAVEEGARAVENGVRLSDQASVSLAKILDSTRLATERVEGVARTTVEQAESSRLVSQAIDRVADMVNQISVATSQQSKGGSLILRATEEMKAASLQVKRNAEEQLQGSKLITKSIENITDMLYSINKAQQEQKRGSHQVVELMDRIKVVSTGSVENARRLSEVVEALSSEAETLREEMRRFKWGNGGNGPGKGD